MTQLYDSELLHPKQPGFVLVTNAYKKYSLMKYGISHFYQFEAEQSFMSGIPDACIDIVFCHKRNKIEAKVAGTLLEKTDVETTSKDSYFGVRFLPGYNPIGKQVKIKELVAQEANYDDFFSTASERDELYEKIWRADTFEEKIKTYMNFYLRYYDADKYEANNLTTFLRNSMIQSGGNIKLNDLQEKSGYSLRYLFDVIGEEFGMAPKELMQILRFQKVIDDLTKSMNNQDMTTVGLNAGYYDQSHFIKEFKKYADFTPKKYISSLSQNSYKEKLQLVN